jgi:hypothetical protein
MDVNVPCPVTEGNLHFSHNKIAIVAGHYCVSPELIDLDHQNQSEYMSFKQGACLLSDMRANEKDGILVLWINDIGVDSDARKIIKDNYVIPNNYLEILDEYQLKITDVEIVFESSMRNKASTLLRRFAKKKEGILTIVSPLDQNIVRCINNDLCEVPSESKGNIYAIDGPEQELLVVKEGPNPKCNLILATFLDEIVNKHSPDAIVNIFNVIYSSRIRFGVHVAKKLFDNKTIMHNFFCDDNYVTKAAWIL